MHYLFAILIAAALLFPTFARALPLPAPTATVATLDAVVPEPPHTALP